MFEAVFAEVAVFLGVAVALDVVEVFFAAVLLAGAFFDAAFFDVAFPAFAPLTE